MPSEQALKERSRKASGSWECAVPVISGKRKRICNMLPQLPLLIWFAAWHGRVAFPALRLGVLLLLAFMMWLRRVRQQHHF